MHKRVGISKKIRFEVFKRDLFKCGYCGCEVGPGVVLEVDHIIPVVEGGDNSMPNLTTACFDCNRGKSKHLLSSKEQKSKDQIEKAKLIKEQRQQVLAFFDFQKEQKLIKDKFYHEALAPLIEVHCLFPNNWRSSMPYFIGQIGYKEVFYSAEIAAGKNIPVSRMFVYFCGICHNKINDLYT